MNASDIEGMLEAGVPEVTHVEVTTRADHPEDDHYQAVIVSNAFEGETLLSQHNLVYEVLDDHLTTDIHAIELTTLTPAEYTDQNEDV